MLVYVTVGSTGFDDLVRTVSTGVFLQSLAAQGFQRLVVQYGFSEDLFTPPTTVSETFGLCIESFDYTDSPQRFIDMADLIISHAGTGSILDTLHSRKPLIAVVNQGLMNNHQEEIAEELDSCGYLVKATAESLARVVDEGAYMRLVPYPDANPQPIGEILDEETMI